MLAVGCFPLFPGTNVAYPGSFFAGPCRLNDAEVGVWSNPVSITVPG